MTSRARALRAMRLFVAVFTATAALTGCGAFGGADAGPTTGTFHIENTSISGANVPAMIDANSLHAFTRPHQPSNPYECGSGPLTEVIGITPDDLRAYVRLPQIPPLPATQTLGASPCGPYFSVAHNPGLPSAEEWVSQSGTLTVTAASGANFTITITGAAMAGVNGTSGTFTATATSVVMNAQGI